MSARNHQASHTPPVALVTGSARRIGAAIAKVLHQAGWRVVIHYRHAEQAAEDLVNAMCALRPDSAIAVAADLTDAHARQVLVNSAYQAWHRLDALVNNASMFTRATLKDTTPEQWQALQLTNCEAPYFLSQLAAPYLQQTKGCIVNITDVHAQHPLTGYDAYCISKAGLAMQTRVLAKALAPQVRVNAVAPGAIAWPENSNELNTAQQQAIMDKTLLKRQGDPMDVALAVRFFVQDAGYVTGQTLAVDGGRYLT